MSAIDGQFPDLPSLSSATDPWPVALLNQWLKDWVESQPALHRVWTIGEVSSAKQFPSGLYFTLADPESEAAIGCVVWRGQADRLATRPQPGQQVTVLGELQVWAKRGEVKLVVWQVLPAGEGLQALRLQQLRDRLAADGLFDPARRRSLPDRPQMIAVVTSPRAAAWGDIQRTLLQRSPGLQVLLSPALVQGDQAPASLIEAIDRVVTDGRAEVLIVSRGGGATEDLSCFNDEQLVRCLADCPIPTITGIGHQRDESLCDLVADWCAHTPTAAAERAAPSLADLQGMVADRTLALKLAMDRYLGDRADQIATLRQRLGHQRPDRQLQRATDRQASLQQRLLQAIGYRLDREQQRQTALAQTLRSLNPAQVLQRGYALARDADGAIVRRVDQLKPGDRLTLQLAEGAVQVQVQFQVQVPEAGQN
ncbi:MAG: exodeoxyribonuclease VII large subunit [Oscillatoriales cyanobacterium]|nr:MAG: exodeoxyribonuclease VII large subunit [Oscillatoriales cyanobacterium]